tara:strand:+ start:216 stop:365 length:150 start_codon:yes stop_codon:yes gene_type:complete
MYDSYVELRVSELMRKEKMTYSEAMAYVEEEIAHKEAQAEALYDASYEY